MQRKVRERQRERERRNNFLCKLIQSKGKMGEIDRGRNDQRKNVKRATESETESQQKAEGRLR